MTKRSRGITTRIGRVMKMKSFPVTYQLKMKVKARSLEEAEKKGFVALKKIDKSFKAERPGIVRVFQF